MNVCCTTCGRPLVAEQLDGLCPACLIDQLGLNEELADTGHEDLEEQPFSQSTGEGQGTGPLLRVPGHTILCELGRGGMGIVYRARQYAPAREVALKMLLPGFVVRQELRHRFRQEAAALSRLDHPAILAVYTTGEHDGFPWFTMKLATGGSLAERMETYSGDWQAIAQLVALLADALQFAHDHGVLHRDLKPANILFDEESRPYLADFGLAKLADSDPGLTRSWGVLGTPQYLAPEIVAQDARAATISSDLYGLGAVLHEMLTGQPPFKAPSSGALLQNIIQIPPWLESQGSSPVPRDLRVICLTCLAKGPGARYAAARELAAELRRFLRGEPILARPAGALERVGRWCRRRPAVATLVVLSGFLLLAVIVVVAFASMRLADAERMVRHKDYIADMRMTDQAVREKNLGQALELLQKWEPERSARKGLGLARNEDLRNFEWRYFRGLCQGDELFTLGQHGNRVNRVALSPDGQRVASAAADGGIRLWDVAGRRLIGEGRHEKRVMAIAFSPDGRWLATGGDDQRVRLWDPRTLQPIGVPLEHNSPLVTLAFSTDGTSLAAIARQEYVQWDVRQGVAKQRQTIAPATWFYGSISPNLLSVALPVAGSPLVRLWNLPPTIEREVSGDLDIGVGFSPDNRFLAAGGFSGRLRVWQANDLRNVLNISAHTGAITCLAWSLDGARLASGGSDSAIRLWDFPTGKLLGTYRGHEGGFISGLSFSPDGSRIVSCSWDGSVRIWDATQPPAPRENPSRRQWDAVQLRNGNWVVVSNTWDIERIDLARIQRVALPLPSELRNTNVTVKLINDGFLAFGPGPQVRRFSRGGQMLGKPMAIPEWPAEELVTSPDGRWLLWGTRTKAVEGLKFWRVGSFEPPTLLAEPGLVSLLPTFSSDSRRLAVITLEGEVIVWDLEQRRIERRFNAVQGPSNGLSFSPNGRQLVVSSVDGLVRIWATDAWSRPPLALSTGTRTIWSVAFSPDGRRLAGGGDDGHVFLWDVGTQQLVCRLEASERGLVDFVGFSPNGEELVAYESEGDGVPGQSLGRFYVWHAPRE